MFDKLKQAFSAVTGAIKEKELSDKDLDDIAFNFQIALIESDVAQSVAEALTSEVQKSLAGTRVERSVDPSEVVGERLDAVLKSAFDKAGTVDLVANIREKSRGASPTSYSSSGSTGRGRPRR